jgi:hypothetical protein
LAEETGQSAAAEDQESIARLKTRLDMLDQRLDNIDSMVTAVAERIMNRPLTLHLNCPNCGKNVEIDVIGASKPGR